MYWDVMVMELICFFKFMIVVINGYSLVGGCVIVIICDYCMMVEGEKFIIGLNEVVVGIMVLENIYELYVFWLGRWRVY